MEAPVVYAQEQKAEKSFDVLASVDLLRYDLQNFGQIYPETWARVYDEELTYIAEGINQPVSTEFRIKKTGDGLAYFHNGQWRPYLGSLIKAVEVYKDESARDPRKTFMYERAVEDLRIGYQLSGLGAGEKLRWKSSFPDKELSLYGPEFIGSLGFQPERRMGFLYEAEKSSDGSLLLKSYSVDHSDEEAFAAALKSSDMMAGYDSKLSEKYGGAFKAGRRPGENVAEENAWNTVRAHKDLIEGYFMQQIKQLATSTLPRSELEEAKKRLTYGVWAALKRRIDERSLLMGDSIEQFGGHSSLSQEVQAAYHELTERGEVLFGCGGAIRGEKATLQAGSRDVFQTIFAKGEKIWMNCPFCGARQYGDPCAAQIKCSACEAEVIDGKIISRGNGGVQTGNFTQIAFEAAREVWERTSIQNYQPGRIDATASPYTTQTQTFDSVQLII